MKKIILILISLLAVVVGCQSPTTTDFSDNYTLTVDPRLDTTSQGLYTLTLSPTQNSNQTIHRITGQLLNNGEEPTPPQLVNWESSHEWVLTDTAYSVVRRTINVLGEWVVIDTINVRGFEGQTVPTINEYSITGTDGEINTVIAPINEMEGDTMIVRVTYSNLEEVIRIVLK